MNWFKRFWIIFLSFLPFQAGAFWGWVLGGVAKLGLAYVGLVGYSIYRNQRPIDINQALEFFTSCWTCQMFSDVMSSMSNILPDIYSSIGQVVIPFALILTAIWFAWQIFNDFINNSMPTPNSMVSKFGTHLLKLATVVILLGAPLPRLISDIAIQPIFNVGLSLNRVVLSDTNTAPGGEGGNSISNFNSCVIATAISDPAVSNSQIANSGAFSPKLRHNLACELGTIHEVTGLGMAVGWTMINMAFDSEYMHKILANLPWFPNVMLLLTGFITLVLFFMALLPVPLYFLEIFIKLSLDLVMLPLMLLGWLFDGWAISLKGAGKSIRSIIDDVINGTLGLATTGVFLSFSIILIERMLKSWDGGDSLVNAIAENRTDFFMNGLTLQNNSVVTILLIGIFLYMFMSMIPALSKSLFNVQISSEYYDAAKKDIKTMWNGAKNFVSQLRK